jgi:hypothetical protein
MNALMELRKRSQSVWLDYIRRDLTLGRSGYVRVLGRQTLALTMEPRRGDHRRRSLWAVNATGRRGLTNPHRLPERTSKTDPLFNTPAVWGGGENQSGRSKPAVPVSITFELVLATCAQRASTVNEEDAGVEAVRDDLYIGVRFPGMLTSTWRE